MYKSPMKALSAALLAAAAIAGPAWAGAGDPTPNSTSRTVNLALLFDGACFRDAFASRYSAAYWYPAYAEAVASADIWSRLYTSFRGTLTFTTTRHGNAGAVYQVDLGSTMGAGVMSYGASSAGANTYTYAAATDWMTVYAVADARSYGTGYGYAYTDTSASSGTRLFAKGANITEFTTRQSFNARHFTQIDTRAAAAAMNSAYAYASGGYSSAWAYAWAEAWSQLLAESVVLVDVTAHYQKKPGNNDEQTIVVDSLSAYLSCGGYASPSAATYAEAY